MERTPYNFQEIGPKYTDDELISFMKNFYEKNKRAPTVREFDDLSKAGDHPSGSTYTRRSSWNYFLEKAGIRVVDKRSEVVDAITRGKYFTEFVLYLKKNQTLQNWILRKTRD